MLSLAIDIGGSKVMVGLIDDAGQVLNMRHAELTRGITDDEIIALAFAMSANMPGASVIGANIPGLCDAKRGIWVYSPFSGLNSIPIVEKLIAAFGLPAYIENDVNACALAERMYGVCRDVEDFMWVTVSSGVGGALVLGGALYTGARGNAGEIGHVIVNPGGMQCTCGRLGCVEAECAGPAITRRYRAAIGETVSAKDIALRAELGDEHAAAAFHASGRYLGVALAHAANIINPARVVLGGGVAMAFELLKTGMDQSLNDGLFVKANPDLQVVKTGLGYNAALIGAAAVAFTNIHKE